MNAITWISVKDRLPQGDEPVLVVNQESLHYRIEQIGARELRRWTEESYRLGQTPIWTHWAERPAPPEGHQTRRDS